MRVDWILEPGEEMLRRLALSELFKVDVRCHWLAPSTCCLSHKNVPCISFVVCASSITQEFLDGLLTWKNSFIVHSSAVPGTLK